MASRSPASPNHAGSTAMFSAMGGSSPGGIAAATLKGKLQAMEDLVRQITEEMNYYKREALSIKSEKETLDSVLNSKIQDTQKSLSNELKRVEDDENRHASHQKAENSRLQAQLAQLKADKEELRRAIEQLADRVDELEVAVGDDEVL